MDAILFVNALPHESLSVALFLFGISQTNRNLSDDEPAPFVRHYS